MLTWAVSSRETMDVFLWQGIRVQGSCQSWYLRCWTYRHQGHWLQLLNDLSSQGAPGVMTYVKVIGHTQWFEYRNWTGTIGLQSHGDPPLQEQPLTPNTATAAWKHRRTYSAFRNYSNPLAYSTICCVTAWIQIGVNLPKILTNW